MKRLLLISFLLSLALHSFAQVNHWEALVLGEAEWQYTIPQSAINDWTLVSFDDSSWSAGNGGFGYGDGDDNTPLSPTSTVYLRKSFSADSSLIDALSFHIDFDDGFVAYLNGVEIARYNMGTIGSNANFNQYANGQHEAHVVNGGFPMAFYDLDPALLENGENILAVEVHNASQWSSDFSALPYLICGVNSTNQNYELVPEWFIEPLECNEEALNVVAEVYGGSNAAEIYWAIYDSIGHPVVMMNNYISNQLTEVNFCLQQGCYDLHLFDVDDDGWDGAYINLWDIEEGSLLSNGTIEDGGEVVIPLSIGGTCPVFGCTDEDALNYMSTANADDGTCISISSSNLPLIFIDTDGANIPDEPKILAHMGIVFNDTINHIDDPWNNYDGMIAIERRGSSSAQFPKKGYGFETRDSMGVYNNNVSLIDLPVENDWVLHAPYSDKSLIRNVLTFELGRAAGRYTPRTKLAELYLNEEYKGVYVLMENIKVDSVRVDIADLNPVDIEGDELTGGYIIKVDKVTGGGGEGWESNYLNEGNTDYLFIRYHRPKYADLLPIQRQYIEDHMHTVEAAIAGPNFADPDEGYQKYIDPMSFIDLSLINELSRNIDGYRLSTYFYKEKDSDGGKLVMGPWWDYNLGYGNANYCSGEDTDGWEVEGSCTNSNPFWFERLKEDPYYQNLMHCRWTELRAGEWSDDRINERIDSLTNLLSQAAYRNFYQWDILGTYIWPNVYTSSETHVDEMEYVRDWILERAQWIDENLEGECVSGCLEELACNYNPAAIYSDGSCEYMELFVIAGDSLPQLGNLTTYQYPYHPGSDYEWVVSGGVIVAGQGTNEIQVIWEVAGLGSIQLIETNADGCIGTAAEYTTNVIYVGVEGQSIIQGSIYPNPAKDHIIVDLWNETPAILSIQSLSGDIVHSEVVKGRNQKVFLDLAPGIYMVQIVDSENTWVQKLLVQ